MYYTALQYTAGCTLPNSAAGGGNLLLLLRATNGIAMLATLMTPPPSLPFRHHLQKQDYYEL